MCLKGNYNYLLIVIYFSLVAIHTTKFYSNNHRLVNNLFGWPTSNKSFDILQTAEKWKHAESRIC